MNDTQEQTYVTAPDATAPKSPVRKNKRIIIGAIGGALLLVAVAAGLTYAVMTNTPHKLLLDSIHNTLGMKQSTYRFTYGEQSAGQGSAFEGKYNSAQGHGLSTTFSSSLMGYELAMSVDVAVSRNGDMFIKYKDITYKPKSGAPEMSAATKTALEAMKATYTKQWVKSDSKETLGNNSCELKTFLKFQGSPDLSKSFVALAGGNSGLDIAVTAESESSATYAVKAKPGKADDIRKSYQQTDYYKEVLACSGSEEDAMSGLGAVLSKGTLELKANKTDRRIQEVTAKSSQDKNATALRLTIEPSNGVTVTVPDGKAGDIVPQPLTTKN